MKATDIILEYHGFVELIDDLLEKQEKADNYKTQSSRHELAIAKRKVKEAIAKFRMTNNKPKQQKQSPRQGGFNFLAL